jgi:DNA-binding transcriptional regulator YhcF (GntR family)
LYYFMNEIPAQPSQGRGMTAAAIERMLAERIQSGVYHDGAQLPTVRDLARQLGVNKNTAVRAYQALERRGYLDLVRGRGAFIRRVPAGERGDGQWRARLDQLLSEDQPRSIGRAAVLRELLQSVDRVFGRSGLRIAFVECNAQDIMALGDELSVEVAYQLEGILLADLLADPAAVAARFDLIVTTFFHLGEVRQALGPSARQKIVGIHVAPNHDALLEIARLHVPMIGLVCDLPSTLDNLTHIIRTYHPAAAILPALIHEHDRMQVLFNKADAIIVTRSAHDRLVDLQPGSPLITVTFTIDQQSIDFLRGKIQEQQSLETHIGL